MKTLAWVGLLGAAATLAGCENFAIPGRAPGAAVGYASPSGAIVPACFRSDEVRNHTIGDAHTLYFDVLGRVVYRVEMSGPCLSGATSSDPLIVRTRGADEICRPIDLDVGVSMGATVNHCIVASLTPMTPAEVAALPPRLRP